MRLFQDIMKEHPGFLLINVLEKLAQDITSSTLGLQQMGACIKIPEGMAEKVAEIPIFPPTIEHEPMDILPEETETNQDMPVTS